MDLLLSAAGIISFAFNFLFLYLWYRDHRPPFRKLSWKKALEGMTLLRTKVEQSGFRPDIILGVYTVGIGGGGVVGDVLASHLQLPLDIVSLDLKGKDGHPLIHGVNTESLSGKRVLVADDVCNSGRTLKAAYDFLKPICAEIKIAVVVKPMAKVILPVQIDFWAFETPYYIYDREWRVQPIPQTK